jgi:membrane carboxypeptidase/penicillin-binding protein PbpC
VSFLVLPLILRELLLLRKMFNTTIKFLGRFFFRIWQILDPSIKRELKLLLGASLIQRGHHKSILEAVLLVEDRRFYKHPGVDLIGILRALYKNIFLRRLEGASTIEQQYVRLITNRREITLGRKLREVLLAINLSSYLSKKHILSAYLSNYRFSGGVVGVDALAEKQAISPESPSVYEIACLVARIKYPHLTISTKKRYLNRIKLISVLLQNWEIRDLINKDLQEMRAPTFS